MEAVYFSTIRRNVNNHKQVDVIPHNSLVSNKTCRFHEETWSVNQYIVYIVYIYIVYIYSIYIILVDSCNEKTHQDSKHLQKSLSQAYRLSWP